MCDYLCSSIRDIPGRVNRFGRIGTKVPTRRPCRTRFARRSGGGPGRTAGAAACAAREAHGRGSSKAVYIMQRRCWPTTGAPHTPRHGIWVCTNFGYQEAANSGRYVTKRPIESGPYRTRCCSRARPARPSAWRFKYLRRLIWPATWPGLQDSFRTAARVCYELAALGHLAM
jgi:hypothetical protein